MIDWLFSIDLAIAIGATIVVIVIVVGALEFITKKPKGK